MGVNEKKQNWEYKMGRDVISIKEEVRNLGVTMYDDSSPENILKGLLKGHTHC